MVGFKRGYFQTLKRYLRIGCNSVGAMMYGVMAIWEISC